jgi:hypothetical protein
MIRRIGTSALALLGLGCAPHSPPPLLSSRAVDSSLPTNPVEVPLAPYFRELRTVRAVSGADTLSLLLDTGGGHTVVTPAAAQRLGCEPFGRTVGHRMSGERVEFQWCSGVHLKLEEVSLSSDPLAVFDLAAVLPPELPTLDGVLALKSFTDKVVTFDLASDRLILESRRSADARRSTHRPLKVRLATGEDGSSLTIFLAAAAVPEPIWLLVDSGNLIGTLLSPDGARQLQVPGAHRDHPTRIEVDLQLIGLPRTPTSALVRDIIYDGALGADFFFGNVFTVDLHDNEPWAGVGYQP